MKTNTPYSRLVLVLFHLVVGVGMLLPMVSKIGSTLLLFFGILLIIRTKNEHNEAILFSAYMVGAEVLFRMSGGLFFYELPKYSIFLFLGVGLYVEKQRHHVSVSYLIYILLLLIGIAFVDIPFDESIRKAIAFNLSGPILLGMAAIYFYHRKISVEEILNLLFYAGLPIIAMLSLLYFKTPDIHKISFTSESNFAASGGFGPNQVATILGFGIFILTVHIYLKKYFTGYFVFDLLILLYLIFRSLLTFSRGGFISALIAVFVFSVFYIVANKNKLENLLKYAGFASIFFIVLFLYTSNATGGMLLNRYSGENAAGNKKQDISAGRATLFEFELSEFYNHPFFGVGVGGSKYNREKKLGIEAASHNEMSRLLGEHGMIGLVILVLLISIPIKNILKQPFLARAFLSAFFLFWILTINHSSMRIAFPAFVYGLSLAYIPLNEETAVHRE